MLPNFVNFWEYVLNPVFLIPMGLVVLAFLPLLTSIWQTWQTPPVIKDHNPG